MLPGTSASSSRVEIDAQLKDRGWEALQKAEAFFQFLLAREFRGDQAFEHPFDEAAVV